MGEYQVLMKTRIFIGLGLALWALASASAREISPDRLPQTITQPGDYRVTGPLAYAGTSNGITVMANGVTIDLNGFALVGTVAGDHGIYQPATYRDLTVRNGIVRQWTGASSYGLLLEGSNTRVEDVQVLNCNEAIQCGKAARVDRCTAIGNSTAGDGYGIAVGWASQVRHCQVVSNQAAGIFGGLMLEEDSSAEGCIVSEAYSSSVAFGIFGDGRNRIEACAVSIVRAADVAYGIEASEGSTVRHCSVSRIEASTAFGASTAIGGGDKGRVERCAVSSCGGSSGNGSGIYLSQYGRAEGNAVRGNRYDGISLSRDNWVRWNISSLNGTGADGVAGIKVFNEGNRVLENHLVQNHYGVKVTASNSFFARNSCHANTQAGSVGPSNNLPLALLSPGIDFNALAAPYNFHDVIW
ncbi:MAG TPA: hypothetical protein DCZ95_10370 [Verrucomicrobia bacterium]|nr:MAG: hypothetical protein A2X46_18775 [Lentisphaerae bacterium GWF2_57_35]HBA84487.1 hypothetical protein [Verrucomicrobiota bacterium]